MRRLLATLFGLFLVVCAIPVSAQVIGLVPYPQAMYYWDTTTTSWVACPNTSTQQPSANLPAAYALYGLNSGLNQWTPFTACPGSGSGGPVIEVNEVPISPSTPADFQDNGTVTWTFDSGHIHAHAAASSSLAIAATSPVQVNNGLGPVSSGTATISCPGCGLAPGYIPAAGGQYALVYARACTTNVGFCSPGTDSSGNAVFNGGGVGNSGLSTGSILWSNFTLPSYINPANVTSVYAFAISGSDIAVGSILDWDTSTGFSHGGACSAGQSSPRALAPYGGNYFVVGQTTCPMNIPPDFSAGQIHADICCNTTSGSLHIYAVGLEVHYTGTAPPAVGNVLVAPPLTYNPTTNTLGISAGWPNLSYATIVANLPQPAGTSSLSWVSDGSTGTDCATGGGSHLNLCYWNGSSYTNIPISGGGSTSPGGSPGQVEYNNAGVFGGFTVNGDGTLNTATGALAVTSSGGVAFGTAAFATLGNSGSDVPQLTSGLLNNSVINWAIPGTIGSTTPNTGVFSTLKVTGAAGGSTFCVQIDSTGLFSNTGQPCGTGGGSGTVNSGSLGQFTWYAANGTVVSGNAHLTDISGIITSTESLAINDTADPSQISLTPTSFPPVVVSGATTLAAPVTVSTSGTYVLPTAPGSGAFLGTNSSGVVQMSFEALNGAGAGLVTGPSTSVNLDCARFTGTVGQLADSGAPCGVGTVGSGTTGQIATYPGSGTAISGASAIPNGITATTQTGGSNDTKVATDAYVDGRFIASGTAAMGTGAISSGTCATVVTVAAAGVVTTDRIIYNPNTDPTAVTGYGPSATGSLYIWAYPTSGNVNFKVCNPSSGSITPSLLTLNFGVPR